MSHTILEAGCERSLKDAALLSYILLFLGLLSCVPAGLAGLAIAYVKRNEGGDSWVGSHFVLQLRVARKLVAALGASVLLCCTIVGIPLAVLLMLAAWCWAVYQLAMGIRALSNGVDASDLGGVRR